MPHSRDEPFDRAIEIEVGGGRLQGDLVVPAAARGLVVFAHGSGSSRLSPRNRAVAAALRESSLATLLVDLMTRAEEARDDAGGKLRFDVEWLAARLTLAIDRVRGEYPGLGLPVGLFGASTGAAAALIAASSRPEVVSCVVSRGGRPDLAGDALELVRCPTLLIVGGDDREVTLLNRHALARLRCTRELAIVPGATHLFEEPGALEQVADKARSWFEVHLASGEQSVSAAHPSGL